MRHLAEESRRRWPIVRIVMVHRMGVVKLGQPSVVVAVSTPHRAEAFEACRFLIDQLKAQTTIWKKELWADGSTSWVEGEAK
jgi:molybdopterin synthase catalytic subunit